VVVGLKAELIKPVGNGFDEGIFKVNVDLSRCGVDLDHREQGEELAQCLDASLNDAQSFDKAKLCILAGKGGFAWCIYVDALVLQSGEFL
jgi:exosome complex RNA-binding protein Rrp42 (RNase PH superfamily)